MPNCGTITVEPRPTVGPNDLSLSCSLDAPQPVRPDSIVTVTYELLNNGDATAQAIVEYSSNGSVFDSETRTVQAGSTVTGQTTVTPNEVGVSEGDMVVETELAQVTTQAQAPVEMQAPRSLVSRLTENLSGRRQKKSRQQPCGCDEPKASRPRR